MILQDLEALTSSDVIIIIIILVY